MPADARNDAGQADWPGKVRALCHGVNNHLAVILGQIEIMGAGGQKLPPEIARRIDEISRAAEQIKALVRQAGAEARGETGERKA